MSSLLSKAPWASKEEAKAEEEGDSLTTVLSTEEDRSALTILIADCTENMRQAIIDTFDAKQTGKKVDLVVSAESDLTDAKVEKPGLADDGKLEEEQKSSKELEEKQKQEEQRLSKELAQREKELSGPKVQELKNAALKHFDDWRVHVIQRIGETVNSRQTAEAQQRQAKPRKRDSVGSPPRKFPDLPKYDEGVQKSMQELYPPIDNPLLKLAQEKRALILHSVLLLMLSLENYQAHSRVLMLRLSTSLKLPINLLAEDESKVARGLLSAAETMQADEETKKKAEENQSSKKWKVGLATVAGAALIGVTGGLAAPLLAAGIGSVMGGLGLGATAAAGYLGTLAGSSVLVGGLFGAYGGRMTGKMMDKYAREVEDFAFIPVRADHKPRKIEKEYRRLRVGIGISGWLTKQPEVVAPWKVIGLEMETFALQWELETLMSLGNSLTTMVTSAAWGYAKVEIVKRTVFSALMAGLWPLGLLKVSKILDNPFSIANQRSQKAGDVLADALINKAQGERPVTLVGYSLGAKVIFTCLQRLAERKAFGLVESVVLIGAPAPSTAAEWRMIRSVVAGRVVNVFSVNDYILAFLYRSYSIQYGVAGLQAIENVKGVENVDVSDIVSGHNSYRFLTGTILKKIGFEDIDMEELRKEVEEFKKQEAEDEKQRQESEAKEKENKKSKPQTPETGASKSDAPSGAVPGAEVPNAEVPDGVGGVGDMATSTVSDQHVKDLEKEIELKNERSYVGYAQDKLVATGVNISVAYQKAKLQWNLRRQGAGGKAAADAAGQVDSATGDVNKVAAQAGVNAPTAGDVGAQGYRAKQDVDKGAPALPERPKGL